jgi:TonB family protein
VTVALLLTAGAAGWYVFHLQDQPETGPPEATPVEVAEMTTGADPEQAPSSEPLRAKRIEPPPAPSPQRAPRKKLAAPKVVEPEDAFAAAPPTRAMRLGDLIRRGWPNVLDPEPIEPPPCVYPPPARGRGLKVQIRAKVLVDEQGRVVEARLPQEDQSGLGFNEATLKAARATRFYPATRDGIAGRMWTDLYCDFVEPEPISPP